MRTTILTMTLAFLATLDAASLAAQAPPDSAMTFPRVEGRNLENRRFMLPGDFEARLNVVVVAFRREQQADVDTWLPRLRQLVSERRDLRAYELPTLNRGYRLMRGFIDGGMSRGIPDKLTREATITVYIDKGPFKRSLRITAEDQIVTLLVTREGKVLWRADGPFAPDLSEELDAALRGAQARAATP